MTNEELDALVQRLDDMSDLSRDHAAGLLDLGHKVAVRQAMTAITTLRAQLARREEMHDCAMKERDDATLYADEQKARADRAEQRVATLEAALAEARAELRHYRHEVVETALANVADEEARADRAEAALSAQIEKP